MTSHILIQDQVTKLHEETQHCIFRYCDTYSSMDSVYTVGRLILFLRKGKVKLQVLIIFSWLKTWRYIYSICLNMYNNIFVDLNNFFYFFFVEIYQLYGCHMKFYGQKYQTFKFISSFNMYTYLSTYELHLHTHLQLL